VGQPPCERPYSGTIDITDGRGKTTTIRSASDGRFSASLDPGTYRISSGGAGFPIVKPFDVVVRAHAYTTITVMFDSGIR
jgi:hypothetical protein